MARKKTRASSRQKQIQKKPESPGTLSAESEDKSHAAIEESYVRDLLARGEAVKAQDGELPPGATHEIIEEGSDPNELPKVVRRRFATH